MKAQTKINIISGMAVATLIGLAFLAAKLLFY